MSFKYKDPKRINSNYGEEILKSRGVTDLDKFLNPTSENLQSFQDLCNIDQGVELLINTLNVNEPKIAIVVDCDVDGFTSAAIIYQYIQKVWGEVNITTYFHEGKEHGLSDVWIDIANVGDYDLLIIPDAASNDYDYIEKLGQISIPVLILDHHIVEDDTKFSSNCVIINNQLSPNYKNKELSGAGVTYQFCRAVDAQLMIHFADDFIDLAALGVCGDMMSALEAENQYLWKEGFSHVKNTFFKTLCEKQDYSMKGRVNPTSVAFYIVPLINAMVRVGTMEEKSRMFDAFKDGNQLIPSHKRGAYGTYDTVANESARECTNAKRHQDDTKKEIASILDHKIEERKLLDNKILFLRLEDSLQFPSELTGLIAMQISARYKRPTIIARLNEDGHLRGSMRGLSNCEISSFKDFLQKSGLFTYVLGHDNAAGIDIANENLKAFHEYANNALKDIVFSDNYYYPSFVRNCSEKDLSDIIFDLSKYEDIWGQNNEIPRILVKNIEITSNEIQVLGRNQDTVKFHKWGIDYIKFTCKDLVPKLKKHNSMILTVYGKPMINEYMGRTTPQIQIEDINIEDPLIAF